MLDFKRQKYASLDLIPVDNSIIEAEPISEKMKEMLLITDDDLSETLKTTGNSLISQSQKNIHLPVTSPGSTSPSIIPLDDYPSNDRSQSVGRLLAPSMATLNRVPNESSEVGQSQRGPPLYWLTQLDTFSSRFAGVIAIQKLQQIFVPNYLPKDEFLACVESNKSSSVLKKIADAFKVKKGDNLKYEGTFGVPLDVHIERYPAKIDLGYGPNPKTVPFIIAEIIRLMQGLDLRVEGIFRKNGNIKRLKDAAEAFDVDPYSNDISQDNQIQLAALMKKYLRELPDPVMTFKLHKLYVTTLSTSFQSLLMI
jgi:hypothetical protein